MVIPWQSQIYHTLGMSTVNRITKCINNLLRDTGVYLWDSFWPQVYSGDLL